MDRVENAIWTNSIEQRMDINDSRIGGYPRNFSVLNEDRQLCRGKMYSFSTEDLWPRDVNYYFCRRSISYIISISLKNTLIINENVHNLEYFNLSTMFFSTNWDTLWYTMHCSRNTREQSIYIESWMILTMHLFNMKYDRK